MLRRRRLTARRAAAVIGVYTVGITVLGGVVARVVDRHDFPTFGVGFWWALQTVTSVGYGDVVPTNTLGRIVGGWLMVSGIAFLAVVTASVTALLIETARRESKTPNRELAEEIASGFASLEARFDKLEGSLRSDRD